VDVHILTESKEILISVIIAAVRGQFLPMPIFLMLLDKLMSLVPTPEYLQTFNPPGFYCCIKFVSSGHRHFRPENN